MSEESQTPSTVAAHGERPVLIIDAMNVFVRSYVAFPQMSSHGYQMGGAIGFLKTLRRLVFECAPRTVIVVWEGGGSVKRRALFSEYKMNRKPERLNRFYEDDIPDSEENKKHQLISLIGMMKHVPVCQVYVADCEGDDVIAYLCRSKFRNDNKIIASSDKDMFQLIDPITKIYNLHKKTYVTDKEVYKEFRVSPQNFAYVKALCGDASDNIPGIKGVGFKKVTQLFPFLGTNNDIVLQDVLNYAQSHVDESAMYQRVIDSWKDVKRNWGLVFLDGSMLALTQAQRVDHVIQTFKPTSDRMALMRLLIKEGIGDFDLDSFFYTFNCISGIGHK